MKTTSDFYDTCSDDELSVLITAITIAKETEALPFFLAQEESFDKPIMLNHFLTLIETNRRIRVKVCYWLPLGERVLYSVEEVKEFSTLEDFNLAKIIYSKAGKVSNPLIFN